VNRIPYLLEFLPYIQQLRGKMIVVKIGGGVLKDAGNMIKLAKDISVLYNIGIKIILVHGGGPQADDLMEKLSLVPKKIAGRRITDEDTIEVAKMVYGGKINMELTAALQRYKTQAVGFSGVSCGTVLAKKRDLTSIKTPQMEEPTTVDFGYVGDIIKIDVGLINNLMKEHIIPVISCLGVDEEGTILNINADTIAKEIGIYLGAEKMIFVTNVPGILEDNEDNSTIIPYLDLDDAKELLKNSNVTGGMLPKLQNGVYAIEGGVKRVHIIDGTMKHSLLVEMFTNEGCGTMIEKETNGGLL